MSELLEEWYGTRVAVWSNNYADSRDEGVLEAFDGIFVRMRSGKGEVMFFPITAIRLIKPLESR